MYSFVSSTSTNWKTRRRRIVSGTDGLENLLRRRLGLTDRYSRYTYGNILTLTLSLTRISFFLLPLSLSLSLTHTHSHTKSHTLCSPLYLFAFVHFFDSVLFYCLSFLLSSPLSLYTLSLSHTHTHTITYTALSISLPLYISLILCFWCISMLFTTSHSHISGPISLS